MDADVDRKKPKAKAKKHDPKVKLERKKQPETFGLSAKEMKAVNLPHDFGIGPVPRNILEPVTLTVGGEGKVNMLTGGELPQVTLVFANAVDRAVFGMELGPEKCRGQFSTFLEKHVSAKQFASGLMGRIMEDVVIGNVIGKLNADKNKTIADGDVFTIPTVFTVQQEQESDSEPPEVSEPAAPEVSEPANDPMAGSNARAVPRQSGDTDVEKWFRFLSSEGLAKLVREACDSVVYIAPGLQDDVAEAMVDAAGRLGADKVLVCLDFDESTMRMGFGSIGAIAKLREQNVNIDCIRGLRIGLISVDDQAFTFTPTALFLESEDGREDTHNALRLSASQTTPLLARLSPAAKKLAMEQVAQADDPVARAEIEALKPEIEPKKIQDEKFKEVTENLEANPPESFDLARQVRVYQAKLQRVDFEVKGLSFNQRMIEVPKKIIEATSLVNYSDRLRTTFKLLFKADTEVGIAVKNLRREIQGVRTTYLRTLNTPDRQYGTAILKKDKRAFIKCVDGLRDKLRDNEQLCKLLQNAIDDCRDEIVRYYVGFVKNHSVDQLSVVWHLLGNKESLDLDDSMPNDEKKKKLVEGIEDALKETLELPTATELNNKVTVSDTYFDYTIETLEDPKFQDLIASKFDDIDWSKPYEDFKAVGQKDDGQKADLSE